MELINLEVYLSAKTLVGPVWLLEFNPQYFMVVCTCGMVLGRWSRRLKGNLGYIRPCLKEVGGVGCKRTQWVKAPTGGVSQPELDLMVEGEY